MMLNLGPLFDLEISQPLAQSRYGELSNLAGKGLVGSTSLGWRHYHCGVNRPKLTIPGCREMSGNHLRASFVKFGKG